MNLLVGRSIVSTALMLMGALRDLSLSVT